MDVIPTPKPEDTATTTWASALVEEVRGEDENGEPCWVMVEKWTERPWTADEIAARQAAADWAAARTAVRTIITDLQAEKTRVEPVLAKTPAQITGGDTKDVARAARRIADAVIDLTRFVGGA